MTDSSGDNAYAPPVSSLEVPPTLAELAPAGRRFATHLVDYAVALALSAASGVAMALARMPTNGWRPFALGFAVSSSYYLLSELIWGRTLGKLVAGTRVVAEDGGRPRLLQLLGRTLARNIPFEAFSFLGGDPPVGWHDSLSGTRVIRIR